MKKNRLPYVFLSIGIIGLVSSISYLAKNSHPNNKIQPNALNNEITNAIPSEEIQSKNTVTTKKQQDEQKILQIATPSIFFNS
ncbi:MAG: hypothetical protein GXP45_03430 [bacterium]|nr:hypothetical protein [bacterium]